MCAARENAQAGVQRGPETQAPVSVLCACSKSIIASLPCLPMRPQCPKYSLLLMIRRCSHSFNKCWSLPGAILSSDLQIQCPVREICFLLFYLGPILELPGRCDPPLFQIPEIHHLLSPLVRASTSWIQNCPIFFMAETRKPNNCLLTWIEPLNDFTFCYENASWPLCSHFTWALAQCLCVSPPTHHPSIFAEILTSKVRREGALWGRWLAIYHTQVEPSWMVLIPYKN